MSRAKQLILQAMHERGEATRPQLAAATGLSEVTVGKAVAALCRTGELQAAGDVPSGGGRPVQLYRYHTGYACHVLVELRREGTLLSVHLRLLDLHGIEKKALTGRFAYLEAESLDGLLDTALRRQRLRSITIIAADFPLPDTLAAHLQLRYHCAVHTPSPAALLAWDSPSGTATLCLQEGLAPTCVLSSAAGMQESGPLHLLPVVADWSTLDYTDRNQVAEVVATLIAVIICTLAPEQLNICGPAWSSRLTERIRYNADTKLRGALPPLHFIPIHADDLSRAAIAWCTARHA